MHNNCEKIGIYGGTFDPIHYGHLIIAEEIREEFGLEKIVFIPTGMPPHKSADKVTDSQHRLKMVEMAVESNPLFELSAIEVDRGGYTYTIDTLNQLRELYGEHVELYFIIGADVIPELITWRNYKSVFAMCDFIAAYRPGADRCSFESEIRNLSQDYSARIHMAEVPSIEISSTMIRDRVNNGKSIKYFLPENVEAYILEYGLYRI